MPDNLKLPSQRQHLLNSLKLQYHKSCQEGKLKTFTKLIRKELGVDWYSEHAFRQRFNGKGLMQCILNTFDETSEYCLAANVPDANLERFLRIHYGYLGEEVQWKAAAPPDNPNQKPETKSPETNQQNDNTMHEKEINYDSSAKQVQAGFTFNIDLAALATKAVQNYVNQSGLLNDVEERIKQEAAKLKPTEYHMNGIKVGEVVGRKHFMFNQIVSKAAIKKQVFIAGPAGTGKTTLAYQISKALGLQFASISCTQGMSEAHLLGRLLANGDYICSKFVEIYENGGVFLFDEVDAADANTLLVINSALANGHLSVPNRVGNPVAIRSDKCIIVCAANTFGNGSAEYAGRNILDAAFLDRFALTKFHIDYDTELERELCIDHPKLWETFNKIRANVISHKLRKSVSTRVFADGCLLANSDVPEVKEYKSIVDSFFTGWTPEEKLKAMTGVALQ